MRNATQTSSLWDDQASRLIIFSGGWKPAHPTGKMPVPHFT
jgi:hypothetical protein